MSAPASQDKGSGYRGEDYGKCLCLSFPGHELDLIEDLDFLAHVALCKSRSHYVRQLIRREKSKYREQQKQLTEWENIWGKK
jgi:hypothetical protein